MKQHKKNKAIARLSIAALALPGVMDTASAGRVEETYNADFQYGHYSEGGSRMQVDIFDGAVSAPVGKDATVNVGLLKDVVTGASPVFNYRDGGGKIKQYLSKASAPNPCGGTTSICEERNQATLGGTYFFDTSALSVGGGLSREHDYLSKFFSTNYSIDLNKKLTTLNFGASVAFDDIDPTPMSAKTYGSGWSQQFNKTKTGQNYLIGISQVVDKDTLFQSNMTFGYNQGYMSDPYKMVAFDGASIASNLDDSLMRDKRPGKKFQWAWLNQYVHHFGQFNDAALHLDYRYSLDSWGSHGHTFEASWHQPIVDDWQLIPKFRYYSQDKADFYQAIFSGNPGDYSYYSNDYRLAGFGALSGGLKLSKEMTKLKSVHALKFQTGIEYYDHNSNYQLGGNSNGSFQNFHYYLVTASFNLKF
jgi:hypothetical protein